MRTKIVLTQHALDILDRLDQKEAEEEARRYAENLVCSVCEKKMVAQPGVANRRSPLCPTCATKFGTIRDLDAPVEKREFKLL